MINDKHVWDSQTEIPREHDWSSLTYTVSLVPLNFSLAPSVGFEPTTYGLQLPMSFLKDWTFSLSST